MNRHLIRTFLSSKFKSTSHPRRVLASVICRHSFGSTSYLLSSSLNEDKDKDNGNTHLKTKRRRRTLPDDGVTLSHFLSSSQQPTINGEEEGEEEKGVGPTPISVPLSCGGDENENGHEEKDMELARLGQQLLATYDDYDNDTNNNNETTNVQTLKFHLKTYGCQMNVNDSDIVRSILLGSNNDNDDQNDQMVLEETMDEMEADILLTNTCAIRENAEVRVWNRLRELRSFDTKHHKKKNIHRQQNMKMKKKKKRLIGVLGCMAERLKEDMFRDGTVDLVVGPDAYRDLPRLITSLLPSPSNNSSSSSTTPSSHVLERAVNVQLSLEETYADIAPVRSDPNQVSAFVSVMRGCNNMCSYCVVPFTRGRERSRQLESIVEEATRLYEVDGVKEIILLGQNVNSYHDRSPSSQLDQDSTYLYHHHNHKHHPGENNNYQTSNTGFTNLYKLRSGPGYRFPDLVHSISSISPELRVRFTSPHPKDYPPDLLHLTAERPNVCNHLHVPAQSGSSTVLQRMRRGYGREAYLRLIDDARSIVPDLALSSDFIAGFCGETEEEHGDTVSLLDLVRFDQAFLFQYSLRGKTHAHRTMVDDVPEDVKKRRLAELIQVFREKVQQRNEEVEVGKLRLVLVEGESRKKKKVEDDGIDGGSGGGERILWGGRTDQNKRILFDYDNDHGIHGNGNGGVGGGGPPMCWSEEDVRPLLESMAKDGRAPWHPPTPFNNRNNSNGYSSNKEQDWSRMELLRQPKVHLVPGDYAVVQVTEARGHTLRGQLLWRATLQGFHDMGLHRVGTLNDVNGDGCISSHGGGVEEDGFLSLFSRGLTV